MKKFFGQKKKNENISQSLPSLPETVENKISKPEVTDLEIEDGVAYRKAKESEADDLKYAFEVMKSLGVVESEDDFEKLMGAMQGCGCKLVKKATVQFTKESIREKLPAAPEGIPIESPPLGLSAPPPSLGYNLPKPPPPPPTRSQDDFPLNAPAQPTLLNQLQSAVASDAPTVAPATRGRRGSGWGTARRALADGELFKLNIPKEIMDEIRNNVLKLKPVSERKLSESKDQAQSGIQFESSMEMTLAKLRAIVKDDSDDESDPWESDSE